MIIKVIFRRKGKLDFVGSFIHFCFYIFVRECRMFLWEDEWCECECVFVILLRVNSFAEKENQKIFCEFLWMRVSAVFVSVREWVCVWVCIYLVCCLLLLRVIFLSPKKKLVIIFILWMRASAVLMFYRVCMRVCVNEIFDFCSLFWKKIKANLWFCFVCPNGFVVDAKNLTRSGWRDRWMNASKNQSAVASKFQNKRHVMAFNQCAPSKWCQVGQKLKSLQKLSQDKKILRLNAIVSGSNC